MKKVGFKRKNTKKLDDLGWILLILLLISFAALCISIITGAPIWLDIIFGSISIISFVVGTILDSIT